MRADVLTGPAPWAVDRFGFTIAAELWVRIPAALAAATRRAATVRRAARTAAADAVSDPRWPAPYEELGAHLRGVPDASITRSPRARYQLVVVRNHVVLPWCYGATGAVSMRDARPGGSFGRLGRELLYRFGGPRHRRPTEPGLPRDEADEHDVAELSEMLGRLDPAPRVLIAGYAGTAEDGLLRVCLGEAVPVEPGALSWRHLEDLPLPPPTIPRPRRQQFP
ncbi:MAG TPA: hypothetical protein VF755_13905 [Catenuloplanes sp.]